MNAFIQALRNITFMLQSEDGKPEGFEDWYAAQRAKLADDPRLKRFVQARNLIVKRQMLESKSEVEVGIFRGRQFKLGVGGEISHYRTSHEILGQAKKFYIGFMLDEGHSALHEQLGVFREWRVEAVGEGEVVAHCAEALRSMASLVECAHELWGTEFDASFDLPDLDSLRVLLESDVDPSLPKKWGWLD